MHELPCGLLTIDSDRVIRAINAAGARLVGWEASALVGQRLSALLSRATRIFVQTHVMPELALRGHLDELYLPLRDAQGNPVPVLLNAARRDEGEPAPGAPSPLFDFAFLPMHRRHLFERELLSARHAAQSAAQAEEQARSQVRAIQDQLAVQDRMAALGTLAAGVAHELNNPLTWVAGNLELLAESLRSGAVQGEASRRELEPLVTEARDGIDRIRGIVRSLRSLSRVEDERRVAVDLGVVVDTAMRVAGHELRARATVAVKVSRPAPVVEGDEGRLIQVLVNLLVNAAQAMPERPPGESRITVQAFTSGGDAARIVVSDNGCGMEPAVRQRLFDPFFTTKPVGVGTGLGLSVCHGIVTALGGSITVDSTPGLGTTFEVTLPLSTRARPRPVSPEPPAQEAIVVPAAPAPASDTPHPRVLVVDDEEGVARILRRALGGYQVTEAADGARAIALLAAGEPFDVILCDLMMPGVDGMEVHAAVCRQRPELAARMVFLTGGAFTDAARAFLDRPDIKSLRKPFAIADVRAVCARVCTPASPASDGARPAADNPRAPTAPALDGE